MSQQSVDQLVENARQSLHAYDVGAFNLRCASDLPGAENLDEAAHLDWLDNAAKRVSLETRRH